MDLSYSSPSLLQLHMFITCRFCSWSVVASEGAPARQLLLGRTGAAAFYRYVKDRRLVIVSCNYDYNYIECLVCWLSNQHQIRAEYVW